MSILSFPADYPKGFDTCFSRLGEINVYRRTITVFQKVSDDLGATTQLVKYLVNSKANIFHQPSLDTSNQTENEALANRVKGNLCLFVNHSGDDSHIWVLFSNNFLPPSNEMGWKRDGFTGTLPEWPVACDEGHLFDKTHLTDSIGSSQLITCPLNAAHSINLSVTNSKLVDKLFDQRRNFSERSITGITVKTLQKQITELAKDLNDAKIAQRAYAENLDLMKNAHQKEINDKNTKLIALGAENGSLRFACKTLKNKPQLAISSRHPASYFHLWNKVEDLREKVILILRDYDCLTILHPRRHEEHRTRARHIAKLLESETQQDDFKWLSTLLDNISEEKKTSQSKNIWNENGSWSRRMEFLMKMLGAENSKEMQSM